MKVEKNARIRKLGFRNDKMMT